MQLPAAFERAENLGTCIDYAMFDDSDGTVDDVLEGFFALFTSTEWFNVSYHPERLRELGYRAIDRATFLGDWYDTERDCLVFCGTCRMPDGSELRNPTYPELYGREMSGTGFGIPSPPGQFAFAFAQPPHSPGVTQTLHDAFDDVLGHILPQEQQHRIWDWYSPHLQEVSNYFDAGAEWWGMFLFSIYCEETQRLTVIGASTSD